jgi:hypothetical protein
MFRRQGNQPQVQGLRQRPDGRRVQNKQIISRLHSFFITPTTKGIDHEDCSAIREHVNRQPGQSWEVVMMHSLTNVTVQNIAGLTGKSLYLAITYGCAENINIILILIR